MTEHSHLEPNSHLSALMDGEVDEFELRRTLDRVGQDSALRDKWRRYHLAASALRKEPAAWQQDLSGRIAEALATEPAPRNRVLAGVLGRTAVAASVALLTIAGVRFWLPFSAVQVDAVADAAVEQPAAQRLAMGQPVAAGLATEQPGTEQPALAVGHRPMAQPPFGVQLPLIQTVAATNSMALPKQSSGSAAPTLSPAEEERVRRYVEERMVRHADVAARREGLLPLVRVPRPQEER